MLILPNFLNLDLLSVGIAVAGIGILGFTIFFNNRTSVTNRTFLCLSLTVILWSSVNYLTYQVLPVNVSFWLLKIVMFFAVWFAFFVFQLLYVFPKEKIKFSKGYKLILLPLAIITSLLTLTNLVFSKVGEVSSSGQITRIVNGPGIILFGIVVVLFNVGGIILLIKKIFGASKMEKKQYSTVLTGIFITLALIIIFNFVLPAFFDNPLFVPFGAVFIFPFIAFTAYAILRHHLLNIKIITTEILTFVLSVVTLLEVIISNNLSELILRAGVFMLILSFGILLIRSVRREVEQRERLEILTNELEMANSKLKELDHLKSQFLSFASHQVKAPMAVVKGYASLIEDGTLGETSVQIKETAGKIKSAADNMINLVNDLLNLRKIEEGKMEYNFEKTEIISVISDIAIGLKTLADKKGLNLEFKSFTNEAFINADGQKIRQVYQNIIENAIKYTDKGWVKINVEIKENFVQVSVSDSGHGMPKDLLPHLFEEFNRDKAERKIEGTGLGLYIAKQIVDAHKGSIWAESDGEGKGSVFFIKMPMTS